MSFQTIDNHGARHLINRNTEEIGTTENFLNGNAEKIGGATAVHFADGNMEKMGRATDVHLIDGISNIHLP